MKIVLVLFMSLILCGCDIQHLRVYKTPTGFILKTCAGGPSDFALNGLEENAYYRIGEKLPDGSVDVTVNALIIVDKTKETLSQ